ncbi:hypothetical protein [Bradyrhizobium sp.]|uniref:hypothetical protein n=1 Tax=Bradyrhizobium sp. TaxID=376 RepID=UPI001D90BDAA|nr:hypothetical protein [Bradyrhizobium sp.]MBI5318811.1 hypothetical protein [Bradyrhizobium sp.]
MARLILTFDYLAEGAHKCADVVDCVVAFRCNFVWGKLKSNDSLKTLFSQRPAKRVFEHWTEGLEGRSLTATEIRNLGLIEFCEGFDAIELWADPAPNTQLQLIWLLDHLRFHTSVTSRLRLVQSARIDNHRPEDWIAQRPRAVSIHADDLALAATAWAAWRAPTPVEWFNLLSQDLSPLPQLRNTIIALLEELPGRTTGLGATEMRMLELLASGYVHPYDLFPKYERPNERITYGFWEAGNLLDGLARSAQPAVSGLTEGPFDGAMHVSNERLTRYENSTLALTDLGNAILAGADDFGRHNPIHRWWGGTELTNDCLWRWDSANRRLVAP